MSDYRFFGSYRLLLATLVLVGHAGVPGIGPLATGNIGVFSFFVLSGFVIAEALDRFYRGAPHRFLINRFLKIYPTYWASCVLAVVLYSIAGHPQLDLGWRQIASNLSIIYSFPGEFTWLTLVWAVAVELRFYFAAAVITIAASYVAAIVVYLMVEMPLQGVRDIVRRRALYAPT